MQDGIDIKQQTYENISSRIYARKSKTTADDTSGEDCYITHEDYRSSNKCRALTLYNGNYLYIASIGEGIFEYSFFDAYGAHIYTGITGKLTNIDEALDFVLGQYDLDCERVQIINTDYMKTVIQSQNQIEKM